VLHGIERLPEFYQRVKNLPYKPGPGKELAEIYRKLSHTNSATIYEAFLGSPVGFSFILPPRWLLSLPDWAKIPVAGLTAWQWLGLAVGVVFGVLIIWLGHRAARRTNDREDAPAPHWRALLLPLSIIFVAGILAPFFDMLLRTGGSVRMVIEYARTGALFLSIAWLAVTASAILGEVIVGSERLTIRSLDDQLIRLSTRLIGIVAAVAILIKGGDELGVSCLFGAGRPWRRRPRCSTRSPKGTIANLIGSLLIALEKPFRVGQHVRIGASEGTVEDVVFRSTRIRTPDNSLVSIPSSLVVNTTVENLSVRTKRRQHFVVQVTYDTPREKLQNLVAAIRQLLTDSPLVEDSTCQVRLNNFGGEQPGYPGYIPSPCRRYTSELAEREALLLEILRLVNDAGVEFAFPTRTLFIENSVQSVAAWPGTEEATGCGTGARKRFEALVRGRPGATE